MNSVNIVPFLAVVLAVQLSSAAQDTAALPQPVAIDAASTHVYKSIGGVDLRLHIFNPTNHAATAAAPAIVFFFGGGWTAGTVNQFVPQAKHFASRGMVAIVADYRVFNRHKTTPFEAIADGKSAIRWVRARAKELGIDPNRIAAAGGSSGGHVALSAAVIGQFDEAAEDTRVSSRPNALVLFNPAVDTTPESEAARSGGRGSEAFKNRFGERRYEGSPRHHLRAGLVPTLILHGTADATIPYADVERFCALARKNGDRCELVGYEGAAHGFFNPQRDDGKGYRETLAEADRFLGTLGYVKPDPPSGPLKTSGNPIIPGWYADPEAHVFAGKYWIYPTYSAPYDQQTFMDAFSSEDLITWTKHPRILDAANVKWATRAMWAPSIVEKDGWYYLFFGANDIQNDSQPGGIGVARARRPEGPFEDYLGRPLIDKFHNGAQPIDQFVFKDRNGAWYIVYGGWRHCNIARLNDDFTGFVPFPDGTTFREITPKGYVEGAYMLIKDGKYYFMWSEGGWTGPNYAVAYAIGTSPFGPFERVGKILEQDPSVATGAGHHSVLQSPAGKWYIVYHRRPLGEKDRNHRVVCIDELRFDENGMILPVVITNSGVAADEVSRRIAGRVLDASGGALPGAAVTILPQAGGFGRQAKTGHEGDYRFEALPDDMYRVDFDVIGFDVMRRNGVRPGGDDADRIDARLMVSTICECVGYPARRRLRERTGQVLDESDHPLPHARVEISGSAGREHAYADGEGRFRVRLATNKSWSLTASDTGFLPETQQVSARSTVPPIVFRLSRDTAAKLPESEQLRRPCRCPDNLFSHPGR